jgi:hypothetical protein
MLVISSREFRQNQKMYLNLVDKNEQVVVQRGKDKSYRIIPVNKDDNRMTEVEFYAKIDKSISQAESGQVSTLSKDRQKELLGL